jgi:hypothetical protein
MSKSLTTRSSNKTQHPGLPDAKNKRRTPAEVAAEKKLKAAVKVNQVATRAGNIKAVAAFQNYAEENTRIADKTANRPPAKLMQKAARPTAETEDDNSPDGLSFPY